MSSESDSQSDIDYLTAPGNLPYFDGLGEGLPSLDPETGIIPGYPIPGLGPAVRFEPGAAPTYIPGG